MNYSKKKLIISLIGLIMLKSVESAVMLDLRLNATSQPLTKDANYFYLDTYLNSCLARLDSCVNGFTLAFNISIAYQQSSATANAMDSSLSNGRIVLVSSGGDSSFSNGFYLHQVNVRGENYLEFGVALRNQLFSAKLYLDSQYSTRLAFTWNKQALNVYIDGILTRVIDKPLQRTYQALNFNPIKQVKSLINKPGFTSIWSALFNDTVLENSDSAIKGNLKDYYLGCFTPKNEKQIVVNNALTGASNLEDQCKPACFNSSSQVFLIQKDRCACYASLQDVDSQLTNACPETSWLAYTASHFSFSSIYRKIGLKVVPSRSTNETIEVGDSLGFSVSFADTNNYKVSFEFGNGQAFSVIGSGFVFDEFTASGPGYVNITAVSLSDSLTYATEKNRIDYKVGKRIDRLPMSSVNLDVQPSGERSIDIVVTAYGGLPYQCILNYGDYSSKEGFSSSSRNTTFRKKYTYNQTGLYVVSVSCKTDSVVSELGYTTFAYLPNTQAYQVNQNYELANLKETIISKPANLDSEFDLEIPIQGVTNNLKFTVVDLLNTGANSTFDWLSPKRLPNGNNLVIKAKNRFLRNLNGDNYLAVKFQNIYIASYLITIEEPITVKPTIKLANSEQVLKLNDPVKFEVSIQMVPNAFIRIDFGDGNTILYKTSQLSPADLADTSNVHTFTVSNTFRRGQEFTVKLFMANQVSRSDAQLYLFFDADLPELALSAPTELSDISQNVVLKLTAPPGAQTLIPNIKFSLDSHDSSNVKVFKNYSFDASNGYSLVLTYQYPSFGVYYITVDASNSHSSQQLKAQVRIGSTINEATGRVVSGQYANVGEDVTFFVKINGGNGYQIQLVLDDGNSMILPWTFIKSRGALNTSVSNSVTPRAKFASNGIFLTYKYEKSGAYAPFINITNTFGSISVTFCSKIVIAQEKFTKEFVCPVSNNLVLTLNEDELNPTKPYILGKSITNKFAINYINCNQSANETDISVYNSELHIYWIINSLVFRDSELLEEPMGKYCFNKEGSNQFELKPNELIYGDFSLKVYAFNVNSPSNYVLLGNYILKVGASPLTNGLQGPFNVELNWNERLELNFYQKSIDPDDLAEGQKNMKFDFVCVNDAVIYADLLKVTQQKAKENDFDAKALGYSLAYESTENNIRFYEKNCMVQQWSPELGIENPIRLLNETMQLQIDALGMNLNFTTFKKPFVVQMILSKMNRVSLSKQVKVFLNISSMAVILPSANLDEMENQLAQLDNLVEKDPKKALSMLGSFADAINERANQNANANMSNTTTAAIVNAENDKLTGLRGKMLGTVDKIVNAVDDPDSFLTAADMTASVTSNADQMPAANQESGANVMASMGAKLLQVGPESAGMIGTVAESMLGTVGNVFGAACGSTPTVELDLSTIDLLEAKNDTEPEPEPLPAKIAAPLEFYEVESEEFPEDKYDAILDEEYEQEEKNIAIREKTSEIAKKSFEGISNAGGAMANNSASNGTTKVEKKGMAIVAAKKNLNESSDEDTNFGTDSGPSIKMPSLSKVLKDGSAPASVATKMLVSASNPFQSSSPEKQAKGTIVSMELTDENGNPLSINGTDAPFVIQVPNQTPARAYKSSVDLIGFTYYKLYLPTDSSSLHFVLKPDTVGDIYHVYISKYTLDTPSDQKYPNEKYNDYAFTLPNNRMDVDDSTELKYTAFIGNNETKGIGIYYIGVKLAVLSEETKLFKKNNLNNTHTLQVNFTVRVFTTACKYWHANTSEWRTDGCFVADTTTFETTVCNCYHLTTFGSDMYVPPNTIDFGTVFTKFNLSDNAAVFSTVVTILGLYVFVALYARYKDKKDVIKWGATPLSDNLPTDNYYYLISVQTGFGRDCGTKSKIGFVLSGENADSGVRKLTDDRRKAFKAGSICNFLMGVEEPLGPLTHLRVWHDNSGKGSAKSWYLNVVSVLDLQNNEKSNFVCNKWFGVEKEDGLIDRVLPVACKNDLTTFKHLFAQSVKKKFTDNHLWFSVFSRPTRSNFTRLQRISTCMSLLFCTMIANAMFYKADSPNSGKQAIQVGPIKFTLSQLFTSIVSTMIVVPVNVIIVTLFRKAKVVHHGIMPVKANQNVAKQRHWRQNIQSIEFDSSQSHFNSAETPDRETVDMMRNKKRFAGLLNIFSKNKTVEYKRESRQDELNKKRGRTLPHWVIYISWTLCFVSTIVPAFFVILYSMQWGKERSNAWLTSIGLSFFQSLLVVDPLKVFIVTALITFIMRKPQEETEDSPVDSGDPFVNAIVNKDEEYLHQNAGGLSQVDIREILHARRAKLAKLQPMDPEELERQRIERLKNIRMKAFLKEGLIYLCYLLVVLFLAHQGRTKNSNLVHTDLTKTFLTNENQIFTDIQSRDDFWNYMESTFLPGLYAPVWYNNKSLVWREKLTSLNRQAIRVGAARLRQLRVKDNTCRVHARVNHMIDRCRTGYNWVDDDTKDYDVGWKPPKNVTAKPKGRKKNKKDCQHSWCYQNTIMTKSVPIKGTFASYKGGGYVAVMGRSIDKSLSLIEELKNNGWIDSLTRAVFFEFTLYNPNVNLFSSCLFIVEFLSTGAATTYHSISVFSLYNYLGSMGVVVLAFQIVYVIFLVYFTIHAVLLIKEEGCGYFKSFWNINDFLQLILAIIAIAMYVMRTVFTNLAIKAVHESELNGFVNFNTIALWDEVYNSIGATIVFSATLKFLKLLRFDKRIGMLAATVRYSLKDLASFAVQFAIFIFAFTQFGYLVFGDFIWSYRDFMTTLGSMFRFSLGQYEFQELISAHFVLGTVYFIGFIFIVLMGLMSMFVSILTEAFEKVKEELADKPNEHEIFGLIANSFKKISKKHRFKERMSKISKSVISVNDESLNVMIKQGQEAHNAAKFSENVNYY